MSEWASEYWDEHRDEHCRVEVVYACEMRMMRMMLDDLAIRMCIWMV